MLTYERVLSYGNIFPLNIECNPQKLLNEIQDFDFFQYNTTKSDIPRVGLSITSLDGKINSGDLESLRDTPYKESSFRTLTDVYCKSKEVQKVIDPFKEWIGRSHLLNIRRGGYFPPHRDEMTIEQHTFRIIIPIKHFNPPHNYLVFDDKVTYMNEGRAYFMNTNITHSDISYSNDTLLMVMNVICCEDSYKQLLLSVHNL
jgi:hypothetical protein